MIQIGAKADLTNGELARQENDEEDIQDEYLDKLFI
jgi:hypothetical protein